jgi:glycosyltransferase involved in cell wall biosynthesis
MRVLLIEPYFGGSHRAWARGYATQSRHCVDVLAMPARFWKWRMQGAALTLAQRARSLPARPDLLLASDMLNLPAFLGLTRDLFADVPVALYCHENQLTYPCPPGETRDLTYGMINWLSMASGDRVYFNSAFHRGDWFDELPRLLKHFPDFAHTDTIEAVQARSSVLPVGCDLRRFDQAAAATPSGAGLPPLVLWNQRWEYDKDPDTFFRALYQLQEERVEFAVALAGQSYRQSAPEFETARRRLGERVVHFGYADSATYAELLWRADVVASTAIQEFFGIAVVEAIYCRCFPILPRRLAYPEIIPEPWHAACLYDDVQGLVNRLRWALTHPAMVRGHADELRGAVARFDWSEMAPRYDGELAGLAAVRG